MSKINGAQSLVNALEAAGVEVMFGIPGARSCLHMIQFLIQRLDIY